MALEAVAEQAFHTSESLRFSQNHDQDSARIDVNDGVLALIDEVSIMETKLGEAIAMVETINAVQIKDGDVK